MSHPEARSLSLCVVSLFVLLCAHTVAVPWLSTLVRNRAGILLYAAATFFFMRRTASGGRFQIPPGTNLSGKVAIVTGGNTGLGKESARALAQLGATVVCACRDPVQGRAAAAEIQKQCPQASVTFLHLNLASLSSVRSFVAAFKTQHQSLHILLNSAGVKLCPHGLTEDGYETHFATNHLGHFLLTISLLPLLVPCQGRVVNVSSSGGQSLTTGVDVDKVHNPATYKRFEAYVHSKLCNILFARELQRRIGHTGSSAYSLHPGFVQTVRSFHDLSSAVQLSWKMLELLFAKSPTDGAQTSLFCCLHPNAVPGAFHADCAEAVCTKAGKDDCEAKRLWSLSAKAVGADWECSPLGVSSSLISASPGAASDHLATRRLVAGAK